MDDRLAQLLAQITDGNSSFGATGTSVADIDLFQRTVQELRELEANGYIEILDLHHESHTENHLIDRALVRKR